MRQTVDLAKAYRLINHGPLVLVSAAHGDQRNVMAAAWVMPLDFSPPKLAVVLDKTSYTRELVEASGEFVLNIPCRRFAQEALSVGNCSGRDLDKFARFKLASLPGEQLAAPLLADCVGWLECRVINEPHNQQAYDLFLGEVVAASADDRVFSKGHWHFNDQDLRTLHYQAGGHFFATGENFEVSA